MLKEDTENILSFFQEVKISRPSDQVVEQILKLINSGVLKPGDLLPPERDLIKSFGISRNYVREGIKTLELYGLVKPTQGKGTIVSDSGIHMLEGVLSSVIKLSSSDVMDLVNTRILLEVETAGAAAENATAREKEELTACLENLRRDIGAGGGLDSDLRLHSKIADMSHNLVLSTLVRLITPDVSRRYLDLKNEKTQKTFEIHRQIVESIVAGDALMASNLMHAHLADAKNNFQDAIRRRQSARTGEKQHG